ncbi:MAG: ABC transporter ATP-binding protein [Symploca sp. SIO2B6]|nr:ABC transporter ATP-binding protein [Symploca sp. SIO2B6]
MREYQFWKTTGAENRQFPMPCMMPETEAIALHHVYKIFSPDHHPCVALNDVTLTIPAGTVQIIMGPSGAGKTTLMLTLAGLLFPSSGTVTLMGHNLAHLTPPQLEQFRRQWIGVVFQESNLLRCLTALENVEAMLAFRGIHVRSSRRQAKKLLEEVGLGNHLHHLPRQLSGGQQQRVSIARALAGHPPIIIADEPTASLDSMTGCNAVALMRQMAREHNCTVVIATHDPRILAEGDRILGLNDGALTKH